MRFAGHRPALGSNPAVSPRVMLDPLPYIAESLVFGDAGTPLTPSIRHPSILIAPTRCAARFAATVPISGLRASTIGSHAGFSAVPHPSHSPSWLCDFGNP